MNWHMDQLVSTILNNDFVFQEEGLTLSESLMPTSTDHRYGYGL